MAIRTAYADWRGNLAEGSGHMRLKSETFEGPYDFRSRMGDGKGTSPEELLGAAHAGCYSMALSLQLTKAGFDVRSIETTANVHFGESNGEWTIQRIDLETEASVTGISEADFKQHAETAKSNCPLSRALASVSIRLKASLLPDASPHDEPRGPLRAAPELRA
jgi:osmotically inducible protein OsmC